MCARPRPCRVQRVIVCFRFDLWLFCFSNYKEMSGLERQELVEKPACRGEEEIQLFREHAFLCFSLMGKTFSLSPSGQFSVLSHHPWVIPSLVILRMPPAATPQWVPVVKVHCQP